jgi:hypothetical protein
MQKKQIAVVLGTLVKSPITQKKLLYNISYLLTLKTKSHKVLFSNNHDEVKIT